MAWQDDMEKAFEPLELAQYVQLQAITNGFNKLCNNLAEKGVIGRQDVKEISNAYHTAASKFSKNETLAQFIGHHDDFFAAILTKTDKP